MVSTYWLGVVAALVVLLFVVELLRRGVLKEKFAVFWVSLSSVILLLAVFPALLTYASRVVGVAVPANLLFILTGVTLLLVCVQLSYEVARLDTRSQRLATELAILKNRVDMLEGQHKPPDKAV